MREDERLLRQMAWQTVEAALRLPLTYFGLTYSRSQFRSRLAPFSREQHPPEPLWPGLLTTERQMVHL